MDLKPWYWIRMNLIDTLASEFWMEWDTEKNPKEAELAKKQLEEAKKGGR